MYTFVWKFEIFFLFDVSIQKLISSEFWKHFDSCLY